MAWLARTSRLLGGGGGEGVAGDSRILVIGVRGAGKSTFMRQVKPRHVTMGHFSPVLVGDSEACKAEQFTASGLTFTSYDLDDPNGYGYCWEELYTGCVAVIVVIDSSDQMNISFVREHTHRILSNSVLRRRHIPVLLLANKCDKVSAMSTIQVSHTLGLNRETAPMPWTVAATDSITGDGFNEAFDWLAHQMKAARTSINY